MLHACNLDLTEEEDSYESADYAMEPSRHQLYLPDMNPRFFKRLVLHTTIETCSRELAMKSV